MSDLIAQLIPLNLLEEKQRFLADHSYNPQFIYDHEFTTAELTNWGMPNPKFVSHATHMLDTYTAPVDQQEYVTEADVRQAIEQFNQRYHLTEPIEVYFLERQVTRCRIVRNKIYFQLPVRYTAEKFQDLLRHELETHALRRINHERQPWAKEPIDELEFRRTEEGLANLHTHLLRKNKNLRKSYLTYVAVATAQTGSFVDVFTLLKKYGVVTSTAWNIAVRTKRGMTDTSKPGGFTKDLCYFEGTVSVWQWLTQPNNDPKDLYLGKVSLSNVAEFKNREHITDLLYPSFFDDMNQYLANIAEIGTVNNFHNLI